jgi:hypothetical protein
MAVRPQKDVVPVRFNRFGANTKTFCDLVTPESMGEELDNLLLTRRESLSWAADACSLSVQLDRTFHSSQRPDRRDEITMRVAFADIAVDASLTHLLDLNIAVMDGKWFPNEQAVRFLT